jgi:hypothetical protein
MLIFAGILLTISGGLGIIIQILDIKEKQNAARLAA